MRLVAGLADSLAGRAALVGSEGDYERAAESYRKAVKTGLERLPEQAVGSSISWGSWALQCESWPEAAEAYAYGLEAIDRLFRAQLTRAHNETWPRDAQGLPLRAAFARAKAKDPRGAVEAIERGRALLLSETLELDRADLERLIDVDRSDLKGRYEAAAGRWNQLSRRSDPTASPGEPAPGPQGEVLTEQLRRARAVLDATVADIRGVPGYERFLLPPVFSDIVEDAGSHPLVYLGATEQGGLALIVGPADASVQPVWLPQLTDDALTDEVVAYRDAYETYRKSARRKEDRALWEAALDDVTAWLWDAAMGEILDALREAPRATLVPAGLLGVLPLHAAWTADLSSVTGRRYALDHLTLTYAPNARAISAAREVAEDLTAEHMVAAVVPAPGREEMELPYFSAEADAATVTFPDYDILTQQGATQDAVLQALGKGSVFHLSCHGWADFAEPLHSALSGPTRSLRPAREGPK